MVLSQYQRLSLWPLRNYSSSRAVTARDIAATEGTAARKMMSSALQHVETAKASHARIVLMTDPEDESEEDYCYN